MLRCIKGNECQTSVCGPGAGGGSRRFIASSGHVLYVSYLHRSFNHTHEPPDVPMRCFFGSSYALVTVCLHINQFVWCMHTTRMRIGMHHTFLTWNELIPMLLDFDTSFLSWHRKDHPYVRFINQSLSCDLSCETKALPLAQFPFYFVYTYHILFFQ